MFKTLILKSEHSAQTTSYLAAFDFCLLLQLNEDESNETGRDMRPRA